MKYIFYNNYIFSGNRLGSGLSNKLSNCFISVLFFFICESGFSQSPWATYYGKDDQPANITTDAAGNIYIGGYTTNTVSIVSVGFQNTYGGNTDAFLVKFNAAGTRLWATYCGGAGDEVAKYIATDASGYIYVTGLTNDAFGLASGGFQNTFGGGMWDAFLMKFDSNGNRLWSTCYGGSDIEYGLNIATDASGNVYLSGMTKSTSGIASGGFQNTCGGGQDAFLAKFDANGSRLWATYYGGSGTDDGNSLATDAFGNVYLGGTTNSTSGIASGGFQNFFGGSGNAGGMGDAFLVKFSSSGNRLWATYYGGAKDESERSIAIDALGNVYIAGGTQSVSGIASGGFQNVYGGSYLSYLGDAFLVKFDPAGSRLWSTYYGGSDAENTNGIAIDGNNNVYLLLETEDYITTPMLADACSYQPISNGGPPFNGAIGPEDSQIAKFNPAGNKLCATYMGGTGEDDLDAGAGIAIHGNSLYITAITDGGYPVTAGAFQTALSAGSRGICVASLCTNICESKVLGLDYTANTTTVCPNAPVVFTPIINNACDTTGYKFQWTFSGGNPSSSAVSSPTVAFSGIGIHAVKLALTTVCKKDSITKPSYITVNNCGGLLVTVLSNSICPGSCAILTSSVIGGTSPYLYSWSNGATTQSINPCPTTTTAYTLTITDFTGSVITTTAFVTVTPVVTVTTIPTNITCNGGTGSALAIASGGSSPYNYIWSTGDSEFNISNLQVGSYTVIITDNNGCTISNSTSITQPAVLTATISTMNGCGTNNASASVNATGGTLSYSYQWSNGQTASQISNLTSQIYSLTITDANNCTAVKTINVVSGTLIIAIVSNDTTIVLGTSTTLRASGGGTYNWNPTTGLSCSTCATPVASPYETTYYCVTVSDGSGCKDNACVTVTVDIYCEPYIPDAFTPNDDNQNDLECIYGAGCMNMLFKIYNRWGEVVFTTNDPSQCWNGVYKNKPMYTDVFYYVFTGTYSNRETIFKKGTVTLMVMTPKIVGVFYI